MQMIVRAFPVLPGKEDAMRAFADAVQSTRAAEAAEFYRRMGVGRETWHLQETPHGPWVIGVTQLDDRPIEEAAQEYAASEAPFDRWFKDEIERITGIDPDAEPLGPPTTLLFDTEELARRHLAG